MYSKSKLSFVPFETTYLYCNIALKGVLLLIVKHFKLNAMPDIHEDTVVLIILYDVV